MSVLTDAVEARYGEKYLIQLTNADVGGGGSATAIDAARLDAAGADAEADFLLYAALAFDETDAVHIAVTVPGVIARLKNYRTHTDESRAELASWQDRLGDEVRRLIGANARFLPQSNSTTTKTFPDNSSGPVSPASDDERFEGIILNPPN